MPKFYDCFPFFNELDLLELRLEELDPLVDGFILVESTRTFQLKPKPLYYAENKDRFAKWNRKITHVVVDELATLEPGITAKHYGQPSTPKADMVWSQEKFQRNCILRGLEAAGAQDTDLALIADADEIPSRGSVRLLKGTDLYPHLTNAGIYLPIRPHFYWLDCVSDGPIVYRLVASTVGHVRKVTPNALRLEEREKLPRHELSKLLVCGWHYSHFGDTSTVSEKRQAMAEGEYLLPQFTDKDRIAQRMRDGIDPLDRPFGMHFIPFSALGKDYPEAVKDNPEKYRHLFRFPKVNL